MRAFVLPTVAGVDCLRIEDIPAPGPLAPGQIRIAMHAASINCRDVMMLSGKLGPARSQGLIPRSDGAGEILEVAPDVTRLKAGDRVALIFNPDWIGGFFRMTAGARGHGSFGTPGVMRDELVVHHSEAVFFPAHLSFEEGATLPCAAVTAWHALCEAAPIYAGMTVLLQGGGVSIFALQYAKLFGARVIVTSSNPQRCARLKTLGAMRPSIACNPSGTRPCANSPVAPADSPSIAIYRNQEYRVRNPAAKPHLKRRCDGV